MAITPLTAPFDPVLIDRLHALNQAHATELSSMTRPDFEALIANAFFAAAVDDGDGLLIVCDQTTAYDSPNFLWFKTRYPAFSYVDRIAVSPARRGEGLARQLYEAVFAAAHKAGHSQVVCEVNFDPPNPGSDAFHAKLGFEEVGRAHLADRGKGVRYLRLSL